MSRKRKNEKPAASAKDVHAALAAEVQLGFDVDLLDRADNPLHELRPDAFDRAQLAGRGLQHRPR